MNSTQAMPDKSVKTKKLRWLLLVLVIAVGGTIRFLGINKGLPYTYYPDEPHYVDIVQNIFKTGDLNPHFFNYPYMFFIVNTLAYIPYYFFGLWVGAYNGLTDLQGAETLLLGVGITTQPSAFLLGRIITALFGIASIGLIYLVGKKYTEIWEMGILAALMLAISPTHTIYSRFMLPHVMFVFFLLLALLTSYWLHQRGGWRQYLVNGIACGLATATMYHGALIIIPMIVAHFRRTGFKGWRDGKIYAAIGASLFTFFLLNPFMALTPNQFFEEAGSIISHYLFATGGSSAGNMGHALSYYWEYSWLMEGALLIFAFIGLIGSLFMKNKSSLLIYSFALPYFIIISSITVRNDRTFLPLIPFLILGNIHFATLISQRIGKGLILSKRQKEIIFYGVIPAMLLSFGFPAMRNLQETSQLLKIDSRETARTWIAENLPHGAKIALESYSPYVDPSDFQIQGFFRLINYSPDWYRSEQFDYLVFSQKMFERFYREPDLFSTEVSMYETLFIQFEELKTFTDGGYEVRIYQVTKE